MMGEHNQSPGVTSALTPPVIVVTAAILLMLLPSEIRIALTVWTLMSLPIGVLVGHCVLNNE